MKRSSLTTAVLAGLAGVVGFASSSNAVELNPDGTGEVLIYPYYTVNAGQQTQLSVVNSTDVAKAVKVRFLEGYNSREVLDFNLFLSPFDVWTAVVFDASAVGAGDGGAIGTTDKSCTAPDFSSLPTTDTGLHYQAFLPFAYQDDGGPTDITRTREGYVELITMADLFGDTAAAVTHDGGVPTNCAAVTSLSGPNDDMGTPTGGLFGEGAIVNVGDGTLYGYNADAVEGFFNEGTPGVAPGPNLFTGTGSTSPSLADASTDGAVATAYVFGGEGTLLTASYPLATGQGIDAVSAVFESSAILNEFVVNGGAQAGTDWVVTFPTKRFYVDQDPAIQPFTQPFGEPGISCSVVGINPFDREEGQPGVAPTGFSPPPPGQPPSSLCHEVNVITFGGDSILGSTLNLNVDLDTSLFTANAGWMRLDLNPASEAHVMRPAANGFQFQGLPTTGFEAVRYVNGNAEPGKLANYSGLFRHRFERSCVGAGGLACS